MSVIAIAIAQEAQLDIVTSSGRLHHALAVQDENEVLDILLERRPSRQKASITEKTDELAELVMTTAFDLNRLTAEQIAELIKAGKDLRTFKKALVPLAEELPDFPDPNQRAKRLKEKAEEVVEAWKSYKSSLPSFALDALNDAASITLPSFALTAGAESPTTLAAGLGLTILLLTYRGVKIWRQFREKTASPYRYLSRVESAGASLILPSDV